MVDREAIERENKRLVSRLKFAGLRQNAVIEDVDMKAPRGLDKALFANAHRLTLKGESLRKAAAKRAGLDVKQGA